MRRDRHCRGVSVLRVLVATAALAALVGVLFLAAARGQRGGRGTMPISSFRPDDSGLLAARLVLEEIGLPVASRRGARLPPGTGNVLIRVAVEFAADARPPEEKAQSDKELAAWVLRGNAEERAIWGRGQGGRHRRSGLFGAALRARRSVRGGR